nr:Laccase-4 like [Ipomoea batatas]
MTNTTKLCSSKPIVTVNGLFPGPTIYATEDDNVLVNVTNSVSYNLTIHWHGIKQIQTGWADGPAYITQCPIQPGQSYVYNFTVTGQRGTLLYHAHILWLRATVHGAIVILPKPGVPYPFPKPDNELVVILGEWWISDVEAVVNEAQKSGLAPNISDAHTINGLSGPVSNCLSEEKFHDSLRSLNSHQAPLSIDHSLLFTMGLGVNPCPTCYAGKKVVADFNNVTFVMPETALINAHFFNVSGVFTDDFPGNPTTPYDYTGEQPANLVTIEATKLYRLAYNSSVQIVLQDTGMLAPENHPIHLHGFNFFAIGRGLGNYNPEQDPRNFNLVDPVERNTIGVPSGGWAAIRFRANNPGVWFLHCHLEVHTTWGLKMAFVVDNGKGPNEILPPPPADQPKC